MLEASKPLTDVGRDGAIGAFASPAEHYSSFTSFIRRQFPVIAYIVVLVLVVAIVYLLTTPPSFTAQATVIIDTHKVQLFQKEFVLGDLPIDSAEVESQVELIKSERIALSVIKDLRLNEDPEFLGQGGGFLGSTLGAVSRFFSSPKSTTRTSRQVVEAFSKRMTVKRAGLTYIIQIAFKSPNPDRAAQIANAIAEAYIDDQLQARYQATRSAGVWLQARIRELREQSSGAERAVVEFKAKNNIVSTGGGPGGRLLNEQQMAEFNSQLMVAQAQTAEAHARLDRIEAVLSSGSPDAPVSETVADTLKSEVVTKLRLHYLELSGRRADWTAHYGANHLAVVNLGNQMREIRSSILDELRRTAETYKSDYKIAQQREEAIRKGLQSLVSQSHVSDQAGIVLRELEGTAQTDSALRDNFLQRYMEAVQQQSFPIAEARVITTAAPPEHKSEPRTLLILAMAGIGGIVLGIGVGRLRDLSDRVFRTGDQVVASLELDCIGLLPKLSIDISQSRRSKPSAGTSKGAVVPRTIVRDDRLLWHVVNEPFSRFTEAIRSIKLAADLAMTSRDMGKVIAVTSALPKEGKSTVAASLAELISNSGAQTVLVDGDLRNPSLIRQLAPQAKWGLLDVVGKAASLEEVVWKEEFSKLNFIPGLTTIRFAHTSDVLGSEGVKQFFKALREKFDYVIVDLSPLAPVVDVRATTHFVDAYVYVIEWGKTKFDVVERAFTEARGVRQNILGVVLNKADLSALNRYDSYYGSRYHKKYHSYHRA